MWSWSLDGLTEWVDLSWQDWMTAVVCLFACMRCFWTMATALGCNLLFVQLGTQRTWLFIVSWRHDVEMADVDLHCSRHSNWNNDMADVQLCLELPRHRLRSSALFIIITRFLWSVNILSIPLPTSITFPPLPGISHSRTRFDFVTC